MKRRHFLSGLTGGVIASAATHHHWLKPAQARLRQPVTWGGAYLQDEAMAMPHLSRAIAMRNASGQSINQVLFETIRGINWSETDIDLAALVDQDTSTTTEFGMVLVFAAEQTLGQIYFPDKRETKYIARLVGYNMVYNVQKRQIIGNFGIRGRYFDALPGKPDNNALPDIYFDLVTNQNREGSIARLMTEKISKYPYSNRYGGKRFKVTSVETKPLVATAAEQTGMNADIFKEQIGYLSTVCFSEQTAVPVIPYTKTAALNTKLAQEMRITAFDGDSALNTTLPLPDAEIGISIILDGWNFNVTPTTDQRNQVSLTMSLTVVFISQDNGKIIFNQQFFAQKDFYEIPKANYIMSRDARVYILHEECIDKIFASITSPSTRSALYEGIDLIQPSEASFVQAVTDDKAAYQQDYDTVAEYLPYPM